MENSFGSYFVVEAPFREYIPCKLRWNLKLTQYQRFEGLRAQPIDTETIGCLLIRLISFVWAVMATTSSALPLAWPIPIVRFYHYHRMMHGRHHRKSWHAIIGKCWRLIIINIWEASEIVCGTGVYHNWRIFNVDGYWCVGGSNGTNIGKWDIWNAANIQFDAHPSTKIMNVDPSFCYCLAVIFGC